MLMIAAMLKAIGRRITVYDLPQARNSSPYLKND
jgi:hypothetical protein